MAKPKDSKQSRPKPVSYPKKLYRSEKNRILAGVAGGISEYFNIDPVLIRIVFILAALSGGSGVLLYFILWLIIPSQSGLDKKEEENIKNNVQEIKTQTKKYVDTAKKASRNKESRLWFGLILIIFGVYLTLVNFGFLRFFDFTKVWPTLLVALGLILLFRA